MPKPKNRDPDRLRFTVSSARTVRLPTPTEGPPILPWPVAALGGGLLAGLAGSLLVTAVVMIAWLSAIAIQLPAVVAFAAQVWLLAHGGAVVIGGDQLTVIPLGLSVGAALLCSSAGAFAFRQGRQSRTGEFTEDLRRRLVAGTAGQVAAGYTAFAAAIAWGVAAPAQWWRPVLGAAVISLSAAGAGAALVAGYRPANLGPAWLRNGLLGAGAGALALLVVAAVAFGVAIVQGETRVATLEGALRFDGGGTFVWSLIALAYLPNVLAWTLAWTLGAGFTVGTGSLVSLSTTQLGLLPAIPVFGALPPVGVGDQWLLAWLVVGVVAGGLGGVVAVLRGRTGPLGALSASAAAGIAVGAVYLGWAAASRGGLGGLRLVDLGPRLLESLLISVPMLLLSAVLAGMVTWFIRRPRPA